MTHCSRRTQQQKEEEEAPPRASLEERPHRKGRKSFEELKGPESPEEEVRPLSGAAMVGD